MIGYETQQSYTVLAYLFVVSFFYWHGRDAYDGPIRRRRQLMAGGRQAGRKSRWKRMKRLINSAGILL